MQLPAFCDVEAAAARLKGYAVATPVLTSQVLDELVGGQVLIKPECLQRTGSFKFRGAWNTISQLLPEQREAGVVAYSSGNHAQGVAAAAALCGMPALIVMPEDTPKIKLTNTAKLGAQIVTYDRQTQSRDEIAAKIASERGAVLVPPFDHRDVIAGQGTVGLELAEQAAARDLSLDMVLVCTGGGGLTAGIGLALEQKSPKTKLYSVEPAGFDDTARSLVSGKVERNLALAGSICDALLSPSPGEMTFEINRRCVAEGLVVSEADVMDAMRFCFTHLKLVAEPGGAVALAAALTGKIDCRGKTVGIIVSGGNADADLFAQILQAG